MAKKKATETAPNPDHVLLRTDPLKILKQVNTLLHTPNYHGLTKQKRAACRKELETLQRYIAARLADFSGR